MQEINQQLEELNISLRNHIASIDFKEFYTMVSEPCFRVGVPAKLGPEKVSLK